MLDKEMFKNQIQKLVIEFEDKGFKMSKERAEQWYDQLKELGDISVKKAIDKVLKTLRYPPTMSDIYQIAIVEPNYEGPIKKVRIVNRGEMDSEYTERAERTEPMDSLER